MSQELQELSDRQPEFVVCVRNSEYPASLEVRKIYQVLPDTSAAKRSLVRIIDESGEDYLYPADYFLAIDLPQAVEQALLQAA